MNTINHHLSESTLSEYASGTLGEALEVVVACHLTLCPLCRTRARKADELGGYFLDNALMEHASGGNAEPVAPRLTALDVLNNIKENPAYAEIPDQVSKASGSELEEDIVLSAAMHGIPMPLARRLPAGFDDLSWKTLAKGVQQVDLKSSGDKKSDVTRGKKQGAFKLLKLQPGTELIEHTHGDHEMTLILQGSYADGIGRYGAGDVADLGPDNTHKPVVDSDVPCIALIASNAPAQYRGLLGRIIQPFVDI